MSVSTTSDYYSESHEYIQSTDNTTDYQRKAANSIPVSETDKEFLERIAPTLQDIQLTKVWCHGSVARPADDVMTRPVSRYGSSKKIQNAMAEKKRNHKKKEESKEKVLAEKEKELWETENWRDRVKDLSSSFSKLTPISEGKKIIAGRGQAFVVDLNMLEEL